MNSEYPVKTAPETSAGSAGQADKDALGALYREYAPRLSAALRKIYGDGPPDPDDISQLAFQRVMERGDLGSIANLKAFIWRTARNLIFASKRSDAVRVKYDFETRQLFFPEAAERSTPERVISAREQLQIINRALLRMPEKRRRAFILHRIEGVPVSEAAHRTGISASTAAYHIARATADLHALFIQDGEE